MKKTVSLFSLAAATSFWRILLLLVALAATQLLAAWAMLLNRVGSLSLEQILDLHVYRFSPAVAVTLATVVFLVGYGGSRSRVNYTMSRLSLSPRSVLRIHVVYCTGVYLLFWLFQVTVVMATMVLYHSIMDPSEISPQLALLTCYRSVYLHPLLPLADWHFWVSTPLICLGLGVNTAIGMMRSWEGKIYLPPVVFSLLTALYAAKPGDYAWAICLVIILWAGVCVSYYQYINSKAREVVT